MIHASFPFPRQAFPHQASCGEVSSLPAEEIVEFLDESGRLLMLGPRSAGERLRLRHKVAGVIGTASGGCFLLGSGREGTGCLDLLATAAVRPGEALADAALRALNLGEADVRSVAELGLPPDDFPPDVRPPFPESEAGGAFVPDFGPPVFFSLFLVRDVPARTAGRICLRLEELEGLASASPELLSPCLFWVVRLGLLRPGRAKRRL